MSEMSNTHRGTARVVTTAAGGLAATYVLLGIIAFAFLLPRGQTSSAGPGALNALVEHGTGWWLAARWLFLLTALLGLGFIVGLRRLAPPGREALADWSAAVGGLGFVLVAVDQARLISHVPGLVQGIAASPDRAREFSNLSFVNLTDRYGLLDVRRSRPLAARDIAGLPSTTHTDLAGRLRSPCRCRLPHRGPVRGILDVGARRCRRAHPRPDLFRWTRGAGAQVDGAARRDNRPQRPLRSRRTDGSPSRSDDCGAWDERAPGTREQLLMALIDRLIADLVESSQAAAPPADPVDVLRQLIELSVDVLATRPAAYRRIVLQLTAAASGSRPVT